MMETDSWINLLDTTWTCCVYVETKYFVSIQLTLDLLL